MIQIQLFEHKIAFEKASLRVINDSIKSSKQATFLMGLSGGSTPFPIYKALSEAAEIDFSSLIFAITDERFVPEDHPDSNLRAIREALLEPLERRTGIAPRVISFNTNLDRITAAQEYEKDLTTAIQEREYTFDLLILGIGPDGHIASLFPHSPALKERAKLTAISEAPPAFVVRERLTITLPEIEKSKEILVLLSGETKRSIVEKLQEAPDMDIDTFPAIILKKHPRVSVHFLAENQK